METSKKIIKSIVINAPKERIWDALTLDENTRQWYAPFSAGTHAVTNWKEGSKVVFKDDTNCGMVGTVATAKPGEEIDVIYTAFLFNGEEDTESEDAKQIIGKHEWYKITEEAGKCRLDIEADMGAEYYDTMNAAWDKALVIIKDIAEKN